MTLDLFQERRVLPIGRERRAHFVRGNSQLISGVKQRDAVKHELVCQCKFGSFCFWLLRDRNERVFAIVDRRIIVRGKG